MDTGYNTASAWIVVDVNHLPCSPSTPLSTKLTEGIHTMHREKACPWPWLMYFWLSTVEKLKSPQSKVALILPVRRRAGLSSCIWWHRSNTSWINLYIAKFEAFHMPQTQHNFSWVSLGQPHSMKIKLLWSQIGTIYQMEVNEAACLHTRIMLTATMWREDTA